MAMKRSLAAAAALVLLLCSGCGYKPVLRSGFVWSNIKSVCVSTIANRTEQPGLGGLITESLREEFARYGKVRVVPCDRADAIFQGEVADFKLSPISFANAEYAAEFRLVVKLKARLVDGETGAVLWEGSELWSAEEYFAVPDLSYLVVAKKEASAKAAEKLAQLISAELFAF